LFGQREIEAAPIGFENAKGREMPFVLIALFFLIRRIPVPGPDAFSHPFQHIFMIEHS
jgi:hypothetical protein